MINFFSGSTLLTTPSLSNVWFDRLTTLSAVEVEKC